MIHTLLVRDLQGMEHLIPLSAIAAITRINMNGGALLSYMDNEQLYLSTPFASIVDILERKNILVQLT
jgi:hypothetical protein